MLAEDRQLVARKSASFTRLVLRHAGHDHPISLLSIDGLRRMRGRTRIVDPPPVRIYTPSANSKKGLDYLQAFQLIVTKGPTNG
jgi:hypothetical protein